MPNNIITEHGYDRLKVWFDRSELSFQIEILKQHCHEAIHTLGEMHFGANWKSSLDIFQPTTECLKLIRKALGNEVRVLLEYVEIALDLTPPPNRPRLSPQLERAFLAAAVPKHHRREAICIQGTWYFERRSEQGERRRPNVLTVYSDRPSKINNKTVEGAVPCLHIEWRISGSAAMHRAGLITLDDLIAFKPSSFWPQHVELYALPGTTQLGRVLSRVNSGKLEASDQAFRKRAANWVRENSLKSNHGDEAFVLYNALRGMDRRAFKPYKISFKKWLNTLKKAQKLSLASSRKRDR
jgi:hypothetical protein